MFGGCENAPSRCAIGLSAATPLFLRNVRRLIGFSLDLDTWKIDTWKILPAGYGVTCLRRCIQITHPKAAVLNRPKLDTIDYISGGIDLYRLRDAVAAAGWIQDEPRIKVVVSVR